MEKLFNKLVRDNIPEIIKSNGEEAIIRILSDLEYKDELYKKLLEETNELIESKNKEELILELADIYEVIKSIAELNNVTVDEVKRVALEKRNNRGGFQRRIFLQKTIDNK